MTLLKSILAGLLFFLANTSGAQVQRVRKLIDSCVKNDNFNGVVLLAKDGRTELLKYSGIANRHYNIPYSEETRFPIFSLTKTFTAVLILQLYENGKINLDSTIAAYFPEYRGKRQKR